MSSPIPAIAISTLMALSVAGSDQTAAPRGSHAPIVIYAQPLTGSGAILHSSWWDPDGSDYDQYVWDGFVLGATHVITGVRWQGGFDPAYFGSGGSVVDFSVAIYQSIGAGTQPDIISPPLVNQLTGGNAGQTLRANLGGTDIFDYEFDLATPFTATGGLRFWLQIEAWQHGIPDWGMAWGSGDGSYFRRTAGIGDWYYTTVPGGSAFELLGYRAEPFVVFVPGVMKAGAAEW